MKKFFVIGNNTSNSLSPIIFNYWFKKYNIKAKYTFVETNKNNFNEKIKEKINDFRTSGFNITIPFKKNIIKHLDNQDPHSRKIGAVNCVTIKKKIKGTNTDWIGFLNSINYKKINKKNRIIILGYGGAGQAIHYGLYKKGFRNIVIFNRSRKIVKSINKKMYTKKFSLINEFLPSAGLIINTTPTNPINKRQSNLVKKTTLVSDIVYRPKNTPFLKSFEKNKKIYGIHMLVEQAIPCFYQWFGFSPKADNALYNKLNKKIK